MIGRGLRGAKNGGSDRCLILNVRATITNFDKALAFSKLDWLWNWCCRLFFVEGTFVVVSGPFETACSCRLGAMRMDMSHLMLAQGGGKSRDAD